MANDDMAADTRRRGGWLPASQDDLEEWLAGHREKAEASEAPLHPVIQRFQEAIASDAILRLYLEQMIAQVPRDKQYSKRHLDSVPQMLRLINEVLTTAPEFSGDSSVMTPLAAILDWTMGTQAGFSAYRDRRLNQILKDILTAWCEFLSSEDSRYVLNDSPSGWKSAQARETIGIDQYQHDPDEQYWGFTSWNDFFTRRFKDGQRPVAEPGNDKVIISPCESTPYGLSRQVQRTDEFWIKSQPYSLQDMLAGDESVSQFTGGTVYQAYLSAIDYHRWHSPVAGTIVRAFNVEGTYFSENDAEGANAVEPRLSQSYLAHVAARAVILIEADDPAIGLTAFIPVGMTEVSSCMINAEIKPGYHVAKGEELGYFQFGGSTYCLVFRPGAIDSFALQAIPEPNNPDAPLVHVRSKIAVAAG